MNLEKRIEALEEHVNWREVKYRATVGKTREEIIQAAKEIGITNLVLHTARINSTGGIEMTQEVFQFSVNN